MEFVAYSLVNLWLAASLFIILVFVWLAIKALIIHERLKKSAKYRDFLQEFYEDVSK